MKTSCILTIACMLTPGMEAIEVKSPDNQTILTTGIKDGKPVYTVSHGGNVIIEESFLGLKTDLGDLSQNLTAINDSVWKFNVHFRQDRIKHNEVSFDATGLTTRYKTAQDLEFGIEWLIGNNDIAFRYLIPRQNDRGSMVIREELTGFHFPEYTTTFITPQSEPMIGWKRTKPSYEEGYSNDAPMNVISQFGRGYTFPALFHVGDNGWVLLSETGVDGSYCASRLSDFNDDSYRIAYPMEEENNGNGSAHPGIALPGATPWRTITFGTTLSPIVETVIPWAPLSPLYEAKTKTSARGTWSWIIWQDPSINLDDQKKFIDLAASMGYDHALVDNWWDTRIGREGIEQLAKYAGEKGTNIAVWYSSSGWWNDIVQGPTGLMSRPVPRKKELKWLRDNGINTIKVDFFGGDKQETMRLYEDILSDAADYGISVIFHGCTLPRGWERLYPNYVGSEAVLASENLIFSQEYCDNEAFYATLHPFIRNSVGSMEYGGTVLNRRMGKNNATGNIRRTSDGFQIATSILYQNPVQNFALTPESYMEAPQKAIDFMKSVPTTWDETRYIDGYPGKYAVIGRRHGGKWYIAGVSALSTPVDLDLKLPMLVKGDVLEVFSDAPGHEFGSVKMTVGDSQTLHLKLYPQHGFVVVSGNDNIKSQSSL